MQGKIVMVTGATAGIGKETALRIAVMGAHVIVVGRSESKSQSVVEEIQQASGNQRVEYMLADLSSVEDTVGLAEAFNQRYDRLDVLVNNTGALFMERGESVDGIESTFALNHLVGYFLLTNLLLDKIKAAGQARIVNVSSDAHRYAKINFDDLEGRKQYSGFGIYGQSKLANVLFTYELARRLAGTGITVNALHPGAVASNFGKTNNRAGLLNRIGTAIFGLFATSVEEGARTSIYLATSPEVEGVTGKYFAKEREKRSNDVSYDTAVQRRLWQVSEEMLAPLVWEIGGIRDFTAQASPSAETLPHHEPVVN